MSFVSREGITARESWDLCRHFGNRERNKSIKCLLRFLLSRSAHINSKKIRKSWEKHTLRLSYHGYGG